MEESSLMDILKKKQIEPDQYERINKNQENQSLMTSALVGATPLLMGFLSGNKGDAYKIASDQLIGEGQRRQKESATLLSYLKSKNESTKKDGWKLRYNPETKKNEYIQESKLTEGIQGPETRRSVDESVDMKRKINEADVEQIGVGKQVVKDAEGRTTILDKTKGTTVLPFPDTEQGISPETRKRGDKISDDFTKSMEKERGSYQLLIQAENLLNTKSQMPNKIALTSLIKSVEGSRMTEEDRSFILSNINIIDRIREGVEQGLFNPEVTARKKIEAREAIKAMQSVISKRINGEASTIVQANSRSDTEKAYFMKRLGQGTYLAQSPKKIKEDKKPATPVKSEGRVKDIDKRLEEIRARKKALGAK